MAHIVKKANGTYLIRVSNGMKNGKQQLVSITFKPEGNPSPAMAKRSAEKYAVLFEELVHSGGYEKKQNETAEIRLRKRMTLEDFVFNYYYPAIKKHLSPNTCRTYELIIDDLLLPSFGRVELEDINSTHLQNFVDYLSTPDARATGAEGLSPATVKRYATVFSSIMAEAWKQKILPSNPFEKGYVHYPKIVQPELQAYSDDELGAFMEALKEEDIRTQALLMIAVTTGIRRGELVGLMWDDINYDTHQLKIQRSIYKPKGENQVIKGTKSVSSNRTVYLSDSGLETLRLWKIEQERQKRHCKGIWNDTGFIFTNESGEAISIYAPTRICAEFEQRHDLRHLKLHGLRHTCGSLMINHGVDAETVKAVLGHESLKTTNRYLHPYESGKKKASETMEALIRGMTDDKTSIHLSGG